MKPNPKDYRPNVGMMIINQKKEIFVGKRIDHPSDFWQMPQGGIDAKEIPSIAALREMEEEVGDGGREPAECLLISSSTWEAVMRWADAGRALMDASFCDADSDRKSEPSAGLDQKKLT